MSRLNDLVKAIWNTPHLFRKILKATILTLVSLVVLYVLVFALLHAVYWYRLKNEVALFVADGGKLDVCQVAPAQRLGRGARLLKAAGILYLDPYDENIHADDSDDPDLQRRNFGEQDRTGTALDKLRHWPALKLYRTVKPEGSQESTSSRKAEQPQALAFNDAWLPHLERHLANNQFALELARKGAEIAEGPFDVDWGSRGMRALPYHLPLLKKDGMLLHTDAIVSARKGDLAGAMNDVRLILRLRRTVEDDPVYVSKLVSYALDYLAFWTLQGVLEFGRPDRANIEAVLKELENREASNSPASALRSETTLGLDFFNDLAWDPSLIYEMSPSRRASSGERFLARGFRIIWITPADELGYLKTMRKHIATAGLPYPAMAAVAVRTTRASYRLPFTFHLLGNWLVPVSDHAFDQLIRLIATTRMARVVLAANLYYIDSGRYPDTLDEMASKYGIGEQIDPYSDKPLIYQRRGDGFIVYSVGPNMTDDGGTWVEGGPTAAAGDIVWERLK